MIQFLVQNPLPEEEVFQIVIQGDEADPTK